MKIAFVDWSNYPYGGDTTYISEFKKLSDEFNIHHDIYFYESGRKAKNFELKPNIQSGVNFLHFSKPNINELFEKLENYDFVCFVQTPHQSEYTLSMRQEILEKFKCLNVKKGLQAHIFAKPSFAFVSNLFDYIAACDILITREDDPLVPTTAIAKKLGKTILPLTLYSDLDKYIDDTPKKNKLLYRGRFDIHKRPHKLGELSYDLKHIPGLEFELMGIDATIGAFAKVHSQEWANTYRFPEKKDGWVTVSRPFNHADGIIKMKECLFGFSPRTKLSGSYLEYAQIEVLQCGGILILSKKEGQNQYMPDGTCWYDIPYFAIWLDEDNLKLTAKEIEKVMNDKELQKLYQETPKKWLKATMDKTLFLKHIELINNAPKTDNTVEDILKAYDWNEEEIEKFYKVNSQFIICPHIEYLENKKIYLYGVGAKKPIALEDFENGLTEREPRM